MAVEKAPFDHDGNMLGYPISYRRDSYSWQELESPIRLKVVGMYRGRSAKGVVVEDENGRRYPMFIKDLVDVLMDTNHLIEGPFEISKRGQNYGIRKVRR